MGPLRMTRNVGQISVLISCWIVSLSAFSSRHFLTTRSTGPRQNAIYSSSATYLSASSSSLPLVVVVSPPGGIGEVAAVKSAEMGCRVRWFVVSPPAIDDVSTEQQAATTLKLSPQAMQSLQNAGGVLELAGSDADKLLLSTEDPESTVSSVAEWTGNADAVICTFDTGLKSIKQTSNKEREIQRQQTWNDAIKVASREAARMVSPSASKIAVLSAFDEGENDSMPSSSSGSTGGIAGLMTSMLSGGKSVIPRTLTEALIVDGQSTLYRLRHGNLFGLPESSPEFSALVGGPKKDAELCDEYSQRAVRVDPSMSVSGNVMLGSTTRSSRLAVGEAAALMALLKVPVSSGMDLCISSQRGLEPVTLEQWKEEFERAQELLSSGQGARLFAADFASVPDVSRLADWLATKWAPAVLRTYDLATIRAGGRPVYVNHNGDNRVEIVWQQLVDFQSATIGTMVIEVNEDGIVAMRGPGDASKGFGSISSQPLNGEDVIVRFLAEAASQAVEKGLAKKATRKTATPKSQPVTAAAVTSLQSSGTVEVAMQTDQGPRTGARRSTERQRGKQRRRKDEEASP